MISSSTGSGSQSRSRRCSLGEIPLMQDRFLASAGIAPALDSPRPASTASITMFVRMIASNKFERSMPSDSW